MPLAPGNAPPCTHPPARPPGRPLAQGPPTTHPPTHQEVDDAVRAAGAHQLPLDHQVRPQQPPHALQQLHQLALTPPAGLPRARTRAHVRACIRFNCLGARAHMCVEVGVCGSHLAGFCAHVPLRVCAQDIQYPCTCGTATCVCGMPCMGDGDVQPAPHPTPEPVRALQPVPRPHLGSPSLYIPPCLHTSTPATAPLRPRT